jgi:hypothetical protein
VLLVEVLCQQRRYYLHYLKEYLHHFFHDFVLDFSGSGGGGGGGGIFLMMIVGYLSKIFLVLLVLSPLSGFSTRFRGI